MFYFVFMFFILVKTCFLLINAINICAANAVCCWQVCIVCCSAGSCNMGPNLNIVISSSSKACHSQHVTVWHLTVAALLDTMLKWMETLFYHNYDVTPAAETSHQRPANAFVAAAQLVIETRTTTHDEKSLKAPAADADSSLVVDSTATRHAVTDDRYLVCLFVLLTCDLAQLSCCIS